MTEQPRTAYFDLETGSVEDLYHPGTGYVRLAGVWMDGVPTVGITDDPAKLLAVLDKADVIVAHNGSGFDLPALARHCGADYEKLSAKLVDTLRLAQLQDPPGSKHSKPWGQKGYYGLDQLAQRVGVNGKITGDNGLPALAAEFGGYDKIPVTDKRYRDYLRQDVVALRDTFQAMGGHDALTDYARREMRVAHLQNRMTLNGWRIDTELLDQRVREEDDRKRASEQWLAQECGLPLTKKLTRGRGDAKEIIEEAVKSPLSTSEGRAAIEKAFHDAGIPHLPRTAPTKLHPRGQLALSRDAMGDGFWFRGKGKDMRRLPGMLRAYPDNPRVKAICEHISIVSGAVAKYAEIAKFVIGDRVHSRIGSEEATDQASGRWAMTGPSYTNLGKRGPKVVQRAIALPDEGHVLITVDLDQVDMRGIAGHCQDPNYMAMFGPGKDYHQAVADMLGVKRDDAKPLGHGANYGMGLETMIARGHDPELVRRYFEMVASQFPIKERWTQEVRDLARSGALLDNGFGRLMRCDEGRAYTQAPALMGQGTARDLMTTAMLRMVDAIPESVHWLRAVVHDEVVLSVPQKHWQEIGDEVVRAFTFEWRGVPITAGMSKPGKNWADCYRKD